MEEQSRAKQIGGTSSKWPLFDQINNIIGSSPKVIRIPNALDPSRPSTIKNSKEYDLNDDLPQVESSNHDSSSEQNENDEEVKEKEEQEEQEQEQEQEKE